jgi:hypothetical protein
MPLLFLSTIVVVVVVALTAETDDDREFLRYWIDKMSLKSKQHVLEYAFTKAAKEDEKFFLDWMSRWAGSWIKRLPLCEKKDLVYVTLEEIRHDRMRSSTSADDWGIWWVESLPSSARNASLHYLLKQLPEAEHWDLFEHLALEKRKQVIDEIWARKFGEELVEWRHVVPPPHIFLQLFAVAFNAVVRDVIEIGARAASFVYCALPWLVISAAIGIAAIVIFYENTLSPAARVRTLKKYLESEVAADAAHLSALEKQYLAELVKRHGALQQKLDQVKERIGDLRVAAKRDCASCVKSE